jgi:hypothetical protein
LGVNEFVKNISFQVYPNPSQGQIIVSFSLQEAAKVGISITDITGRQIQWELNYNFNPGDQTIELNGNKEISGGIYFINLNVNGIKVCRKIVVE